MLHFTFLDLLIHCPLSLLTFLMGYWFLLLYYEATPASEPWRGPTRRALQVLWIASHPASSSTPYAHFLICVEPSRHLVFHLAVGQLQVTAILMDV